MQERQALDALPGAGEVTTPIGPEHSGAEVVPLEPAWKAVPIPEGYQLSRNGVEKIQKSGGEWLAGPVWVEACTHDHDKGNWGLLVRWLDRDNRLHERAVPASRLHETATTLAQELADEGLAIAPGKERALLAYLGAFKPSTRMRSVTRLGWTEEPDGRLVYVRLDRIIAREAVRDILYQPRRDHPSARALTSSGTLEDWWRHVAGSLRGNPLLIFSTSAAFAAPLLKAAGMDGGGFHLYGESSRGKTTALQVAASVWGNGADPAEAPGQAAIHRWNATRNGLEGLASAHNDGLLALDELGTCGGDDFGKIVYDLAGGQGKATMNVHRQNNPVRSWRVLVLSTGEISGARKIQETKGTAKAGQLLRFMDIPITGGVIIDTRGLPAAEFANRLKRACATSHGTAGPAFVEALIERYGDLQGLQNFLSRALDTWTDKLTPAKAAPEQRRAIRRLALVLVAGLMAQEFGILPEHVDIRTAITTVRDAWLAEAAYLPEGMQGILKVKHFIMAHRDRFRDALSTSHEQERTRALAGYLSRHGELYLFTDEGFSEACAGHDPKTVARALAESRLLHMNDERFKSQQSISVDGKTRRMRLYAVKADILEFEGPASEDGTGGTVGQWDSVIRMRGLRGPMRDAAPGQMGHLSRCPDRAAQDKLHNALIE